MITPLNALSVAAHAKLTTPVLRFSGTSQPVENDRFSQAANLTPLQDEQKRLESLKQSPLADQTAPFSSYLKQMQTLQSKADSGDTSIDLLLLRVRNYGNEDLKIQGRDILNRLISETESGELKQTTNVDLENHFASNEKTLKKGVRKGLKDLEKEGLLKRQFLSIDSFKQRRPVFAYYITDYGLLVSKVSPDTKPVWSKASPTYAYFANYFTQSAPAVKTTQEESATVKTEIVSQSPSTSEH